MAINDIYNLNTNESLTDMDLNTHSYNSEDNLLILTEDIIKSETEETDVEYIDIKLLQNDETTFLGRFILDEKYFINHYLKNDKLLITAERNGKIADVLLFFDIEDKTNIVVPKINAVGYYLLDSKLINLKNPNELVVNNDPERRRRQK